MAKNIVEMPSEVAKEMAKLLSDSLNYEEASNPDSIAVALGADVLCPS